MNWAPANNDRIAASCSCLSRLASAPFPSCRRLSRPLSLSSLSVCPSVPLLVCDVAAVAGPALFPFLSLRAGWPERGAAQCIQSSRVRHMALQRSALQWSAVCLYRQRAAQRGRTKRSGRPIRQRSDAPVCLCASARPSVRPPPPAVSPSISPASPVVALTHCFASALSCGQPAQSAVDLRLCRRRPPIRSQRIHRLGHRAVLLLLTRLDFAWL